MPKLKTAITRIRQALCAPTVANLQDRIDYLQAENARLAEEFKRAQHGLDVLMMQEQLHMARIRKLGRELAETQAGAPKTPTREEPTP